MTKSAGSADLVTLTEDILNGKLHFFLCSVNPCGPYFLVFGLNKVIYGLLSRKQPWLSKQGHSAYGLIFVC